MDAARAAAQSWPDTNPNFVWPPPEKRKRQGLHHQSPAPVGIYSSSTRADTRSTSVAQRAVAKALARAAALDRTADALLGLGRHLQAERLAHQAAALREACA